MEEHHVPLSSIPNHKTVRIKKIIGGHEFQRKMRVMGIRDGQIIVILSKQPFQGPLTIAVCGCHMTLGRGMAQKIIVEMI